MRFFISSKLGATASLSVTPDEDGQKLLLFFVFMSPNNHNALIDSVARLSSPSLFLTANPLLQLGIGSMGEADVLSVSAKDDNFPISSDLYGGVRECAANFVAARVLQYMSKKACLISEARVTLGSRPVKTTKGLDLQ